MGTAPEAYLWRTISFHGQSSDRHTLHRRCQEVKPISGAGVGFVVSVPLLCATCASRARTLAKHGKDERKKKGVKKRGGKGSARGRRSTRPAGQIQNSFRDKPRPTSAITSPRSQSTTTSTSAWATELHHTPLRSTVRPCFLRLLLCLCNAEANTT